MRHRHSGAGQAKVDGVDPGTPKQPASDQQLSDVPQERGPKLVASDGSAHRGCVYGSVSIINVSTAHGMATAAPARSPIW